MEHRGATELKLKSILMLTTGGTIASKETSQGLAPELSADDILSFIPTVCDICRVETVAVCNLDSTNVTPSHWLMIAQTIEENDHAYDGFVICHGTDTLADTLIFEPDFIHGSTMISCFQGESRRRSDILTKTSWR